MPSYETRSSKRDAEASADKARSVKKPRLDYKATVEEVLREKGLVWDEVLENADLFAEREDGWSASRTVLQRRRDERAALRNAVVEEEEVEEEVEEDEEEDEEEDGGVSVRGYESEDGGEDEYVEEDDDEGGVDLERDELEEFLGEGERARLDEEIARLKDDDGDWQDADEATDGEDEVLVQPRRSGRAAVKQSAETSSVARQSRRTARPRNAKPREGGPYDISSYTALDIGPRALPE
jgi:hypothetical protein